MATYPRGSQWRIWDLHVHTPASIVHKYTGAPDNWAKFLDEIAGLPPDIQVLGINDYWFLDGYKRVRAEFERGRFPNICEIFPVLEVRCDTFSGTDGHLSRINLHLICDPLLSCEQIDSQLRPLMQPRYQLTDSQSPLVWSELVTPESLIKLGEQVIAAAPASQRSKYPGPLETGFGSLNVSFEGVRSGIASNTALKDHVILALGKTEWAEIKWSQQSAAQKKSLINSVQAVFTAAPSREAFNASLVSLHDAEVNHRLLHCSDAHEWSDSTGTNRLGHCFTWINADPTFKGLHQALQEYRHRVYIDERPAVLTRTAQSPQSIISQVVLKARPGIKEAKLFDTAIELNPGFIVVIGNKGQGKSALLDSIALAANSDRQDDFSFLTSGRFRSGGGREAAKYQATVTWADGQSSTVGMNEEFDRSAPVRVDYLAQGLIEKVCSADPDSVEKRAFEAEIERVVFRHIDDVQRGTATSLSQLLLTQGATLREGLAAARSDIAAACADLAALDDRAGELAAMNLPDRKHDLVSRLEEIEHDLAGIAADLNSAGGEGHQRLVSEFNSSRAERDRVAASIDEAKAKLEGITASIETTVGEGRRLSETVADAIAIGDELASRLHIDPSELLQIRIDDGPIERWRMSRLEEHRQIKLSIESPGGLSDQLAVARRKVEDEENALRASGEESQGLLRRQADLQAQAQRLRGEAAEPESLNGVEALIAQEESIPAAVAAANEALKTAFNEAHEALTDLMDLQKSAYEPATQFVLSNPLAASVDLKFDVEFRIRGFADRWLQMVNRQKLGHFFDTNRADRDKVMLGATTLGDAIGLFATLNHIVERLGNEGGGETGRRRTLDSIMRSAYTQSDLLASIYCLEWLDSQYVIRSGESELAELSPGQRGLVLLLFYLLVDKSTKPLLLDQPEENLDNQTVRKVLVPSLREAVGRRQVIAVTHNPNFAVVGDADQIVVAEVHDHFEYRSGSLAELSVGTAAIDVLEGTRAAFSSRQFKYDEVVGT